MLYFVALLAEFIYHDITYEDRMSEYFTLRDNKDNYSSDQDDNKVALFGIEFGVIVPVISPILNEIQENREDLDVLFVF